MNEEIMTLADETDDESQAEFVDKVNKRVAEILEGKGPKLIDCILPEDKARWDELVAENEAIHPSAHTPSPEQIEKKQVRMSNNLARDLAYFKSIGYTMEQVLSLLGASEE